LRVHGAGFVVQGLGFKGYGAEFGVGDKKKVLRVQDSESRVQG
jgi:hypothetical protein